MPKATETKEEPKLLTYEEIKHRLREPIPKEFLSQKKKGNANIDFVNVTDCKDLLDARLGANNWEAHILFEGVRGKFYMLFVRLFIHAEDGIFAQDGNGCEQLNDKGGFDGYGDPASNAFAQALRRAAESHGLARELWRRELSLEQKEFLQEQEAGKAKQAPETGNVTKFPAPVDGNQKFASKSQIDTLQNLRAKLNRDEEKVALYYSGNRAKLFKDLYFDEAANAIKAIQMLIKNQKNKPAETAQTTR